MFGFRLVLSLLRAGLLGAAVFAGLAMAAVPGPHRAFVPESYGLVEVSPTLYLDDPAAAPRVAALIAGAEAATRDFFGPLEADPAWVVCTTPACEARLALRSNGLTYAAHLIVIRPLGLNPRTMTHERVHAELKRYLGVADLLSPRFPAWFDEGLATHLAGDDRLRLPADPRDADWIARARTHLDWTRMRGTAGVRDRYGAAARLVAEIEEIAGRDGLRALVRRVGEEGADFEAEWRRLIGR